MQVPVIIKNITRVETSVPKNLNVPSKFSVIAVTTGSGKVFPISFNTPFIYAFLNSIVLYVPRTTTAQIFAIQQLLFILAYFIPPTKVFSFELFLKLLYY